MAQKVFKGFMQVTEETFSPENGYIYFVRKSANTSATDGYLQFNGKKYGTAAELEADVNAKIGTLPEGYNNVVDFVNGQISAITNNFSSESVTGSSNGVAVEIGQASGNVTAVTVTAPDFDATYAPLSLTGVTSAATRLEAIEADYLKGVDKTALEGTIGTLSGRVDNLEAIDADNRLDALENVSADTRLDALEADTHTHENKDVLDGITQAKVDAWDSMAGGANVVLSAYTGSDAGVTDGFLKTYEIFQGGVSKGKIDIPKDLVVTSGVVTTNDNNEKVLRLTIANQAAPVDILVSDLAHVYTQGNGIEISASDEISAKVVAANGLSVDANGIAMALADGSNNGAMSAADFAKLGTIEASAQTNVIETVKVDGTALTVTNKEVNIELPDYSNVYAPKNDFEAVSGLVNTINTDYLKAADKTELNNAITAETAARESADNALDTRLDALEAISGKSHEHANKTVLDGISSEDVAAWDAAEQNAKDYADGLKNGLNADVSGESNGVSVQVVQASGVVTDVNVTAPDFGATYAPISLTGTVAENKTAFDNYTAATDTRLNNIESSATTWNNVAGSADTRISALEAVSAGTRLNVLETSAATKTEVGTLSGRVDALEAVSADTRLDALEAVSANTRLDALEAVSAQTSSALQSISAADNSVTVGQKDSNKNQTVGVKVSSATNNALKLENDGLFAAVYYDGDDSD